MYEKINSLLHDLAIRYLISTPLCHALVVQLTLIEPCGDHEQRFIEHCTPRYAITRFAVPVHDANSSTHTNFQHAPYRM